MHTVLFLREAIDHDVFDYQTLTQVLGINYSKTRDVTARLAKEGVLIRIRKGLYTFGAELRRSPVSREYLANLIYGPSCVGLEYALGYYSLIPEKVSIVTSMCTGRSREFHTPFGVFSYRMLKQERYSTGVSIVRIGNVSFMMASAEKALIDKVWTDGIAGRTTPEHWERYLEDDLRIDTDMLSVFSMNAISQIADAYNSEKIFSFASFLKRYLEGRS
jgi:predicted transcriptional regulator of viral defense system